MKKMYLLIGAVLVLSTAAQAQFRGRGGFGGGGFGGGGFGDTEVLTMSCDSNGYQHNRCYVNEGRIVNVSLVNKKSNASCNFGSDWGYDSNEVWVSNGCRADFRVVVKTRGGGHGGGGHGGGGGRPDVFQVSVTCESNGYQHNRCYLNQGRIISVSLVNKKSRASCNQGSDWGYDRDEIWVSNGCRADFVATVKN